MQYKKLLHSSILLLKKRYILAVIVICLILTGNINLVSAASPPPAPSSINGAFKNLNLNGVLSSSCTTGIGCGVFNTSPGAIDYLVFILLTLAFSIAGIVALIMMVRAGFVYMNGNSDRGAIEQSRSSMIRAAIGFAIIAFSYYLAQYVFAAFHLPSLVSLGGFGALFNSNFALP